MANLAWYQYYLINNYGSPDPYGGFPKPDMNIAVPSGVPITALFAGTVTCIESPSGRVPSWGHAITIKMDASYNSVANHYAMLHLASLSRNMHTGIHVNVGDILGYSGGTFPGAGLQQASVGFALYAGDCYGYGSEWNQYLGSPYLNPTNIFERLQTGQSPQSNLQQWLSNTSSNEQWIMEVQKIDSAILIIGLLFVLGLVAFVLMVTE